MVRGLRVKPTKGVVTGISFIIEKKKAQGKGIKDVTVPSKYDLLKITIIESRKGKK